MGLEGEDGGALQQALVDVPGVGCVMVCVHGSFDGECTCMCVCM